MVDKSFNDLFESGLKLKFAEQNAVNSRLSLDHKKFLDMQIDQTEDKFIELVEGTRALTANSDNYLKRIATVGLISKTGVPKTTSRVFRTIGGHTYDAGKFVVDKSKQLLSSTPLSGLVIKDEAELEYQERTRKMDKVTEQILRTGGSFPTNR